MERRMAQLDSDKKILIGQALLNFAIGSLRAVELVKHGQALPVKDAIPLPGKMAVDASGLAGSVVKLARAANVGVPDARAASRR
jgi:hypothetical protein